MNATPRLTVDLAADVAGTVARADEVIERVPMSALGHELKSQPVGVMSALPLNGDIVLRLSNVSLGP
jgi:hypothetical protein